MANWLSLTFILLMICPFHLLTPINKVEGNNDQNTDDVKELESLKFDHDKPKSVDKASTVAQEQPQDTPEPMPTPLPNKQAIPPVAKSPIFRHRGITQARKRTWNDPQANEAFAKYAGIQYSPADLAAYVFNTGDEEGVAIAVEELVREGMMGRTDAISYLQGVKQILGYLRDQYERRRLEELIYHKPQMQEIQDYSNMPQEVYEPYIGSEKRISKSSIPPAIATSDLPEVLASTVAVKSPELGTTVQTPKTDESLKNDDEKRRVPPRTSTELTLEVIYKLAKDMFSQSILRDDLTAEETLSGLVTFLENEVGNKRISPAMKEKVLEVVSAALVESLKDYQGYMTEPNGPTLDESGIYQQLSEKNGSPSIQKVPMSDYRKFNSKSNENMLQILAPKMGRLPKTS